MKSILKITALALVIVLGSSFRNTASAQYNDRYENQYDEDRDVSYQTFYDELSPHGRWVDYPGHGYVWVPDAGPDFRPYSSNGHWVWSDNYEWIWVSDYDWGWAPFHYGRWDNDPSYGWYWVPGYEWSPAWVAWRDGGQYYGWAPIRPGININFNIGGYSPPNDFWCFTPRRYITSHRPYDHYIDRRQNITIINYTTIITNNYGYNNNYGFRSGPRRYDAERYCGRINPVSFRQSYSPGRTQFRNNEISVYRPNVRRDNNQDIAPRRFDRYDRNNTDNRTAINDNGFRRNDNINEQGDRDSERRFERPADRPARNPNQGNSNTGNDSRRFERNDNNRNDQPGRETERRVTRPSERTERNPNNGNNNGNNDDRRFERRGNNNGNNSNIPVRQPEVRRNDNDRPQHQPQQMERRQEPRPQQPQQMERRQEPRPQQPQQMERKQEQRQQPQQQPTRQVEKKDDGNHQQGNSSSNDNRESKRRF